MTAAEIRRSADALRAVLRSAGPFRVRDAARLRDRDDLLLFLERPASDHVPRRTLALQVAPGGRRGRVCPTGRRFARHEFASGPLVDRLSARLRGRTLDGVAAPAGTSERRLTVELGTGAEEARDRTGGGGGDGPVSIEVELFGPRGLWALLDAEGTVLELSRLPDFGDRTVEPGRPYVPPEPPAAQGTASDDPHRFDDPVLDAVDAHFGALDRKEDVARLADPLDRALSRRRKKLRAQAVGLRRQAEAAREAPALRRRADLLLAYGFQAPPGARSIRIPDPDDPEREIDLPLDPDRPVPRQAEALYDKARRQTEAATASTERIVQLEREADEVDAEHRRLAQIRGECLLPGADLRPLADLFVELSGRGLVRLPPPTAAAGAAARSRSSGGRAKRGLAAENLRRFRTCEGYTVLVGRDNKQNDRLTVRYAKGNDLWFHVGGGQAGSHVVVRLPKGRTASLESLLDAGTLAIHFSKARGADPGDVVYTQAKNVRKPKGLPPGAVLPSRTRELRIRHEPDRLRRLLDSASGEATMDSRR